ncbi:MAG: FAD-binding oxidoreductase [Chloroherpetonaceae bacterium]|nr:FAD-binding oxidoreductase [Chloroherpetonaceae bacterium]MDW8020337.1 FAD-binding oxidoreductase [Chloroherpetonaceae bacterium]
MVVKTDPAEIQSFLEDTSVLQGGHTEAVYLPETYNEVAELLSECWQKRIRLTLSGNGTGTTGGRIPFGGYTLAFHRLNKILNIQKFPDGSGLATVQAGALLYDVQQAADELGLLYTPDPTERYCFIGATIANNSSGARTFKYGPTRPYVQRLKLAFADGEICEVRRGEIFADASGWIDFQTPRGRHYRFQIPAYTMPHTSKHVAGYYSKPEMDLIDLFIGSEGTLAVILEADLRLIPKPEKIFSALVYFDNDDHLLRFVEAARTRSQAQAGISARAIEFFDAHSLRFLRQKYPNIPPNATGAIFFEQETTAETEDHLLAEWYHLLETHSALLEQSWIALTPNEQQQLRAFRHALPVLVNEWYARFRQRKISTDMAVPHARFPELLSAYRQGCHRHNLDYILFGHIGDSHLHLNILPKNAEEAARAYTLYRHFIQKTLELGGTISAEHGIGKIKAEYLVMMFGEEGIKEMVRIKKVFDERLILNIGNLIPEAYLLD